MRSVRQVTVDLDWPYNGRKTLKALVLAIVVSTRRQLPALLDQAEMRAAPARARGAAPARPCCSPCKASVASGRTSAGPDAAFLLSLGQIRKCSMTKRLREWLMNLSRSSASALERAAAALSRWDGQE